MNGTTLELLQMRMLDCLPPRYPRGEHVDVVRLYPIDHDMADAAFKVHNPPYLRGMIVYRWQLRPLSALEQLATATDGAVAEQLTLAAE